MGSLYCYNCRYSYTSSVDELVGCKWEVHIATIVDTYSCTSSVDELVGCKWEFCIATIVDTVAQVQWMNWWVVNGKSILLQL